MDAKNAVFRVCATCGHEFTISKFQPYIKDCEKHRSKSKYIVRAKREPHSARHCCAEAMRKVRSGLIICPVCKAQFWAVAGAVRDWSRGLDSKFQFYIDGKMVGRFESVKFGLAKLGLI